MDYMAHIAGTKETRKMLNSKTINYNKKHNDTTWQAIESFNTYNDKIKHKCVVCGNVRVFSPKHITAMKCDKCRFNRQKELYDKKCRKIGWTVVKYQGQTSKDKNTLMHLRCKHYMTFNGGILSQKKPPICIYCHQQNMLKKYNKLIRSKGWQALEYSTGEERVIHQCIYCGSKRKIKYGYLRYGDCICNSPLCRLRFANQHYHDDYLKQAKAIANQSKYQVKEIYPKLLNGKIRWYAWCVCPQHGLFSIRLDSLKRGHLTCQKCLGYGFTDKEYANKLNHKFKINNEHYECLSTCIQPDPYHGVNRRYAKIKCKIHNHVYISRYDAVMSGERCKRLMRSKPEKIIAEYFYLKNIKFESEKKFDWLPDNYMAYDFYIPSQNLLLEYDGEQHFSSWNKSDNDLKERQIHDALKNDLAIKNGYRIIRIPYNVDLKSTLFQLFESRKGDK